jgi:hypothetical protein
VISLEERFRLVSTRQSVPSSLDVVTGRQIGCRVVSHRL